MSQPRFCRLTATIVAGLAFAALWSVANAQQVFRIIGPDGRVTFSDKPPVEPKAKAAATASPAGGTTAGGAALPYELRQVAGKYPVTLYTGENCVPCGSGRAMLTSRGIPFTERTVATAEDAQALQRLSGDNTLPLVSIGGQQLKGYSDSEWTQYLDAAGYPKTSVLPAGYRNTTPTPLVAAQRPTPAQAPAAAAPTAAVTPPPAVDSGSNPAGIRF